MFTIVDENFYIVNMFLHDMWFAYFCSLLNPLIYCWRLEKLRGALFDILHLWRAQDSLDVELQTQRNNYRPHPSDAWPVAPTG